MYDCGHILVRGEFRSVIDVGLSLQNVRRLRLSKQRCRCFTHFGFGKRFKHIKKPTAEWVGFLMEGGQLFARE